MVNKHFAGKSAQFQAKDIYYNKYLLQDMNVIDKSFKEIFSSQIVSLFGGLIAGIILAVYSDKIFLIPGMLILLPGFLEMRGNISGSFASRLSSGLFLRVIDPHKY